MCSAFIPIGSASAAETWSVRPVYGLTAVSLPSALPKLRVTSAVRDGFPVM